MRGIILAILILVLFSDISLAATIHGDVYSFDLSEQKNAIVTIDTEPKQTQVAKNGTYSFNVPAGAYSIEAKYREYGEVKSSVIENISISQEGDYVLDLILFPDFQEEESLMNAVDESDIPEETDYLPYIIIGILL